MTVRQMSSPIAVKHSIHLHVLLTTADDRVDSVDGEVVGRDILSKYWNGWQLENYTQIEPTKLKRQITEPKHQTTGL